MSNNIGRVFSKFDVFGTHVGLFLQKKRFFRTPFGGFISFGFVVVVGIFFWTNIVSFLNRENVSSASNLTYSELNPPTSVNHNTFMFGVKIDHPNFLTNPLFNITLEDRSYETLSNGTKLKTKKLVPLEPCTLEHWLGVPSYGQNMTQIFEQQNLSQLLCPRMADTFLLGGTYTSKKFYYMKFSVIKCQDNYEPDSLWKPKCQSDEEINDFFNQNINVRFNLYTTNYNINPLQNENPINLYIEDSIFFSIQKSGAYQTADIFYSEYNVKTDYSILPFKDIQQDNLLVFQNFRNQYVIGINSTILAEFYIRHNMFRNEIQRSFQKISQIISYIGGFCQIFILIMAITVNYYNKYVLAVQLANKIYDFQYSDGKTKKKILPQTQVIEQQNQEISQNQEDRSFQSNLQFRNKAITYQNQSNASNTPLPIINEDMENTLKLRSQSLFFPQNQNFMKCQTFQEDQLTMIPLDQIKSIVMKQNEQIQKHTNKQFQQNKFQFPALGDQNSFEISYDEQLKRYDTNKDQSFSYQQSQQKEQKMKEHISNNECINKHFVNNKIFSIISQNQNFQKVEYKNTTSESIIPESPYLNQSPQRLNLNEQYLNQQFQFDQPYQLQSHTQFEKFLNKNNQIKSLDEAIQKISKSPKFEQNNIKTKGGTKTKKNEINYDSDKSNFFSTDNNQDKQVTIQNNTQSPNRNKQLSDQQKQFDTNSSDKIQINSNTLFYIPKQNSQIKDKLKQQQQQQQSISSINSQTYGSYDNKQFLNQEFKLLLKKDSSIKVTFKFFLYKMTCGKFFRTEQVLLLDKANKQIKQDLDIFKIISKLKEIEKLKELLLDKNQQILFNFFPKPIISVQEKEETISRESVAQHIKKRRDSNKISKTKDKSPHKLNLSFKTASIVQEAVFQFKKPLNKNINKFDSMTAYQQLYDAYQYVRAQKETVFNKKLIEHLGEEMNRIFERSNKIAQKMRAKNKIQKSEYPTLQTIETPTQMDHKNERQSSMQFQRKISIFKQPQQQYL